MAVLHDANAGQNTSVSGSPPNDHNFTGLTIASNSNRVLVAIISWDDSATLNDVTWNGTSLTQAVSLEAYTQRNCEIWYLINPDAGNHTLTASYSESLPSSGLIGISLYNADQTDPIGVTGSANVDNKTGTSYNVTTEQNDSILVIGANYEGGTGNLDNPPSGFTSAGRYLGSGTDVGGAYKTVASAGSTAAGFSHSSGINQENVSLAVEIKEVTSSAGIRSMRQLVGTGQGTRD